MAYGFRTAGRFEENKRAVRDKDFGPLVEDPHDAVHPLHAVCIRFLTEIAGVQEAQAPPGAGEDMEITTYIERALDSELSANIVDLCPVGRPDLEAVMLSSLALELVKTRIDRCGCGMRWAATIRIDSRGHASVARAAAAFTRRSTRSGFPTRPGTRSMGLGPHDASTGPISFGTGSARRSGCARPLDLVRGNGLKMVPGERQIAAIAGDLCGRPRRCLH